MLSLLLLSFFRLSYAISEDSTLAANYQFSAVLDVAETAWIYWSSNHSTGYIDIVMQFDNPGWIAIGISPNGQMPNSDIMLGWVDSSGNAYIQDRHTETNRITPTLDDSQDLTLLWGNQNGDITTIAFRRKLDTCDENDRAIKQGTLRIIYAYNPNDPDITNVDNTLYQHTVKGSRSLDMFTRYIPDPIETDYNTFDFLTPAYTIPHNTSTNYVCVAMAFPSFTNGSHMVYIAPKITSGHEGYVHHIVLYGCVDDTDVNTSALNIPYFCATNQINMGMNCRSNMLYAWAVGGEAFTFPAEAGFPLGGTNGVKYGLLEMHYDNPNVLVAGLVDSSGFTIGYTETKRIYDAATIMMGVEGGSQNIFLPGGLINTKTMGVCASTCTDFFPQTGIKVIANFLHSHTHGYAMKLRHVRNGTELALIDENLAYDFNYQQMTVLPEPITILPGDDLIMECYWNTENVATDSMVYGGESTTQEMCLSFLTVYPTPTVMFCLSGPTDASKLEWSTAAQNLGYLTGAGINAEQYVYNVSKPGALNYFNEFWLTQTEIHQFCTNVSFGILFDGQIEPPMIKTEYIEASDCPNTTESTSTSSTTSTETDTSSTTTTSDAAILSHFNIHFYGFCLALVLFVLP